MQRGTSTAMMACGNWFTSTNPLQLSCITELLEPPASPLPPGIHYRYSLPSRIIYIFCLQSHFSNSSSSNAFGTFVAFYLHCFNVPNRWLFGFSARSLIFSRLQLSKSREQVHSVRSMFPRYRLVLLLCQRKHSRVKPE